MSSMRTLSPPAGTKAAFDYSKQTHPEDSIPWWLAPGDRARRVHEVGAIVAPDPASGEVLIVAYKVPSGLQFAWTHLIVDCTAVWSQGNGDALFTIDIDNPPALDVPQGYPLQGFNTVQSIKYGAFSPYGPYPLSMPEIVDPNRVCRIKVTNVNIAASAPNNFVGAIIGWTRPAPSLL